MIRLHERDFVAMGEMQKQIDCHLRLALVALAVLSVINVVCNYYLPFLRVSPNTCHTANSDKVKPNAGKNRSGDVGRFLTD